MTEEFKDTNFEQITSEKAKVLVESMPEFEATTDISTETTHKLFQKTDLSQLAEESAPEVSTEVSTEVAVIEEDNDLEDDVSKSIKNIDALESRRDEILDEITRLAKASDSARVFEVLGDLIDKFASLSDRRMEVHLKKAKVKEASGVRESGPKTVHNTLIMSNKDMMQMIRDEEAKFQEEQANANAIEVESKPVNEQPDKT